MVFQSFGGGHGVKRSQRGTRDDQPHYCHVLPGIDMKIAQEHWYWLLAPRPVLGVRGSANGPFDDEDRELFGAVWQYADVGIELELQNAEGGHEYFVEPAVEFFSQTFASSAL